MPCAPTWTRARRSRARSTRSATTCSAPRTRRTRSSSTATSSAASASRPPARSRRCTNELGDRLRYVWRHAPLTQYHPNALAGAEAAEAASLQGKFFEFERGLFADQENQRPSDIVRLARELGLDVERFERDLTSPEVTGRVRDDMLDAEAMGITSVPTLFINGRRHTGPYDAQSLIRALSQSDQGSAPDRPRDRARSLACCDGNHEPIRSSRPPLTDAQWARLLAFGDDPRTSPRASTSSAPATATTT